MGLGRLWLSSSGSLTKQSRVSLFAVSGKNHVDISILYLYFVLTGIGYYHFMRVKPPQDRKPPSVYFVRKILAHLRGQCRFRGTVAKFKDGRKADMLLEFVPDNLDTCLGL